MICIVVICALLSGGGPRECEKDSLEPFYLDEPRTRLECREVFYGLQAILPANLRLVRFDWAKPQTQTAEGNKK
jgi:hypothetical protein